MTADTLMALTTNRSLEKDWNLIMNTVQKSRKNVNTILEILSRVKCYPSCLTIAMSAGVGPSPILEIDVAMREKFLLCIFCK